MEKSIRLRRTVISGQQLSRKIKMSAINKLLDNARKACSLSSDAALAQRLGVSRAQLSAWRVGREAVPEDRIAEIARVAHADAGEWRLLIEAEQARGEARKAYGLLVKRLGIAALLAIATAPAMAAHFAYSGLVVPIMSRLRKSSTRWHDPCRAI
jgi:DNA-binding transcriptional regulator YdaS (Cro superfamily)